MDYLSALNKRRSYYAIDKNIAVDINDVKKLLESIVISTPSAYNSQSQRMVLLLNDQHNWLWDKLIEKMKSILNEDQFEKTKEKIESFKNGYGTLLFFDDGDVTDGLLKKFPLYKENFKTWSVEQNGMLQINVWQGLRTLNLGASLQHYNELIGEDVKSYFNLPNNWVLRAQMPFGGIVKEPDVKPKNSLESRFKIFE